MGHGDVLQKLLPLDGAPNQHTHTHACQEKARKMPTTTIIYYRERERKRAQHKTTARVAGCGAIKRKTRLKERFSCVGGRGDDAQIHRPNTQHTVERKSRPSSRGKRSHNHITQSRRGRRRRFAQCSISSVGREMAGALTLGTKCEDEMCLHSTFFDPADPTAAPSRRGKNIGNRLPFPRT